MEADLRHAGSKVAVVPKMRRTCLVETTGEQVLAGN